jgi:hypothetical protein
MTVQIWFLYRYPLNSSACGGGYSWHTSIQVASQISLFACDG